WFFGKKSRRDSRANRRSTSRSQHSRPAWYYSGQFRKAGVELVNMATADLTYAFLGLVQPGGDLGNRRSGSPSTDTSPQRQQGATFPLLALRACVRNTVTRLGTRPVFSREAGPANGT